MKTYNNISLVLFLTLVFQVSPFLCPVSDALELNSLSVQIEDKAYLFNGNVTGTIEEKEDGVIRVAIGVGDRAQKAKLFITADCENWDKQTELSLSTRADQIMMVFKDRQYTFTIMPAVQFVKDSEEQVTRKNTRKGEPPVFTKETPDWKTMSRAERLATGKGIIRNSGMESNSLSLVISPVITGGKLTELVGTFSGIAAKGEVRNNQADFIDITNGQFRIEVRP